MEIIAIAAVLWGLLGVSVVKGNATVKKVANARKQQHIVTFISEANTALNESALAYDLMGIAQRFKTVLPAGRYVIHAPAGYSVVGPNQIEPLRDHDSVITMVNEDGNYLFTYVTAKVTR